MNYQADVNALISLSAVNGLFEPAKLMYAAEIVDIGVPFIGEFATLCDEFVLDNMWCWLLKPTIRRKFLSSLRSPALLEELISNTPENIKGDDFGFALQCLLRGESLHKTLGEADEITHEVEAYHAALQFAKIVPVLQDNDLDSQFSNVKRKVKVIHRKMARKLALPSPLFGRDEQRTKLSRFLRSKNKDGDIRPIIVSGIGGVGKSALLTSIASWWDGRKNHPLCVHLDFDRPQLASGDLRELLKEFSRDLLASIQNQGDDIKTDISALERLFSDFRRRIDRLSTSQIELSTDQQFQLSKISAELIWDLGHALPDEIKRMPIAVFFDSFETVARKGLQTIQNIIDIERMLRTDGGFENLRTVIGGRELPNYPMDVQGSEIPPSMIDLFGPVERHIRLGALSEKAAASYLKWLDEAKEPIVFPSDEQRIRASKIVDCMPLKLQVLSRYAETQSAEQIESFVDELENDEEFRAEFAHTFLYERILDRIADAEVKQLAHPGLVLREITPDMIQHVLAEPCGLADVDFEKANLLFNDLGQEYWLVNPTSDSQSLRHRPDLRHDMLPGLLAGARANDRGEVRDKKNRLQEAARKACEKAIHYFETGPLHDARAFAALQEVPTGIREANKHYYRALLDQDPGEITPELADNLLGVLGDDFQNLPRLWQVKIFLALDMLDRIKRDDEKYLTDLEMERVFADRFQDARMAGETFSGYASDFTEPVQPRQLQPNQKEQTSSWKQAGRFLRSVESVFASGNWEEIELHTETARNFGLRDFMNSTEFTSNLDRASQVWESHIWKYVLMSSVVSEDSDDTSYLTVAESMLSAMRGQNSKYFAYLISRLQGRLRSPTSLFPIDPKRLSRIQGVDRLRYVSELLPNEVNHNPLSVDNTALSLANSDWEEEALMYLVRDQKLWPQNNEVTLSLLNEIYAKSHKIYLQELDRMITSQSSLKSYSDRFELVRGLTPELYEPIRNIMSGLSDDDSLQLIHRLIKNTSYWPIDISFGLAPNNDQSFGSRAYSSRINPTIIETADRCGVLRELLVFLLSYDQRSNFLLRAYDRITDSFFKF